MQHERSHTHGFDYSSYSRLHAPVAFHGVSVKYVVAGTERYRVNGREYIVSSGQYLLGNRHCEGVVTIDSATPVTGICVDITPALLAEIAASWRHPDAAEPEPEVGDFLQSSLFPVYRSSGSTALGALLRCIGDRLAHDPHDLPGGASHIGLAEALLADQRTVYRQYRSVRAVRPATRADLLRRVWAGKEYIDGAYMRRLDIAAVAREASLSEYHFFRLFRSVYGTTPHQYILRKRLEHARRALLAGEGAVSDIALRVGFADVHSFSKAFKKQYGSTPSSLLPRS